MKVSIWSSKWRLGNKLILLHSIYTCLSLNSLSHSISLLPTRILKSKRKKIFGTTMAIRKQIRISQTNGLKQILKRCSSLGKKQQEGIDFEEKFPTDVPRGHFAVYVGTNKTRHIIPISYLSRPEFQYLLRRAEEEFDFGYDTGLTIPCEEVVFRALTASLG